MVHISTFVHSLHCDKYNVINMHHKAPQGIFLSLAKLPFRINNCIMMEYASRILDSSHCKRSTDNIFTTTKCEWVKLPKTMGRIHPRNMMWGISVEMYMTVYVTDSICHWNVYVTGALTQVIFLKKFFTYLTCKLVSQQKQINFCDSVLSHPSPKTIFQYLA